MCSQHVCNCRQKCKNVPGSWQLCHRAVKEASESEKLKLKNNHDMKDNDVSRSYLIFVIFFKQSKFLENKIYTKKRVNYDKLHSKLPILRVNYDKLHSKLPIFCIKSVKIYTGPKKFTRAPPVAPVTNMRYACKVASYKFISYSTLWYAIKRVLWGRFLQKKAVDYKKII